MQISIEKIKIQNRIREDFGDIQSLADSIKKHGLLQPIVVTKDYTLIAGERRLKATKLLKETEIEVIVRDIKEHEQQLLCEIAENEERKEFTIEERVKFGKELEQVEKLKAKEREIKGKKTDPMDHGPQGTTRDIVAKKIGIGSGRTYSRAKEVVDSGNKDLIDKMNKGKVSIRNASDSLKSKPLIEKEDKTQDKKCSVCGLTKPRGEFRKHGTSCKRCADYSRIEKISESELKIDGDKIFKEITDITSTQNITYSEIVTEISKIINDFINSINPYSYKKIQINSLSIEEKKQIQANLSKAETNINMIKKFMED